MSEKGRGKDVGLVRQNQEHGQIKPAGEEVSVTKFGSEVLEAGLIGEDDVDDFLLKSITEGNVQHADSFMEEFLETLYHSAVLNSAKAYVDTEKGQVTFAAEIINKKGGVRVKPGKKPIVFSITFPCSAEALAQYQRDKISHDEKKMQEKEKGKVDAENRGRALQKIKELILKKTGRDNFVEVESYEFSSDDIKDIGEDLKSFLDDSWVEPVKNGEAPLSVEILENETVARFTIWDIYKDGGKVKKSIRDVSEQKI